jgi:membrane peptidoglycan carboxypeptidase
MCTQRQQLSDVERMSPAEGNGRWAWWVRSRTLGAVSWMRPRDHNIFVNAGSLVLCGLLAGVVVAAVLFPGVAVSGLVAKEGLERFDELPDELTVLDGPQISYIYASDGQTLLATMYDENRRNISLSDVPQVMTDAVLAAEDRNFYDHIGVDVRGIARAFVANIDAGETTQGASTVTQQFVRLALTYFADTPQEIVEATESTTARKLREARLAMAVEKQMPKDEILERYLNLAYFGEGAYGIFAASQVYFGKQPIDLEIHEAAMLAGIIQAPSEHSPASAERVPDATERRNWVIDQMVETGAITRAEGVEAKAVEIEPRAERQPNECVNTTQNHWGFFCDYFYRWWMEQEAFGATTWERERRLKGGGYHIVTTLDVDVQQALKDQIDEHIDTGVDQPHALMHAAVEPGTGKVRGMATNRNFSLDESDNGEHTDPAKRSRGLLGSYPNTTNPLMAGGGDITGYHGGSTFKLFTMIAALEQEMPLDTTIHSPFRVTTGYVTDPGPASCGNFWCPRNFSENMTGTHTMWGGFGRSVNTFFARLIERAGSHNAVDAAERMGIKFRATGSGGQLGDADFAAEPLRRTWGPFTLGVSDTVPLDLATAYATVSAEGIHCEPIPVEEIRTAGGDSLDLATPDCNRALKRDVALAAIDAGRCSVGAQSLFGQCTGATASSTPAGPTTQVVGKPIWGKTGTSEGTRTYSFVLSTKQLTIAGMMADPDWPETDQEMRSDWVRPSVIYAMRDAMKGKDSEDWPEPGDKDLVFGPRQDIPDVSCMSIAEAEATLSGAGFEVDLEDTPVDSECAEGQAAGTTPSGSTTRGGAVTILVSNGSGYEEPEPEPSPTQPGEQPGPPGNGEGGGNGGDDDEGGEGGGDSDGAGPSTSPPDDG